MATFDKRATADSAAIDACLLVGRVLLAFIFLRSGFGKLVGFSGLTETLTGKAVPLASIAAAIAILLELGGAVLVILGLKARWGAIALIVFTALATFYFHNFWDLADQARQQQLVQFMKNTAIVGGLLYVAALGPGRWSVDGFRLR